MEWAEKLKDEYSKIARENQRGGQGGILLNPNLGKANITTDGEVAREVGIGGRYTRLSSL